MQKLKKKFCCSFYFYEIFSLCCPNCCRCLIPPGFKIPEKTGGELLENLMGFAEDHDDIHDLSSEELYHFYKSYKTLSDKIKIKK